jgi:hypothetical protein
VDSVKPSEYVAHYLQKLREGYDEDAFFGLIEAEPALISVLIEAVHRKENATIRPQIVHCIWQHRRSDAIDFLA